MLFNTFPSTGHITDFFGNRGNHPVTGRPNAMHYGVDFGNSTAKNLKIVSVGEGSVRVSEFQKGYGEVILIRHFDKSTNRYYETLYAHLSKRHVKVGDYVGAGQYIGLMGSTGTSSALHLHFELFFDRFTSNYKSAVNPLMYITDDSVMELQSKLKSLNIPVTIDGYHGKETVDAIKTFQKRRKLKPDGICGVSTLKSLDAAISTSVEEPPKQVASTIKPNTLKPVQNNELTYSSPSLQKVVEDILKNDENRKLIVSEAIKSGANEKVWMDKLNNNTISNLDLMGLATKNLVGANKNK